MKDEEYFAIIVTSIDITDKHPKAARVMNKVVDQLKCSPGFRKTIAASMEIRDAYTESGIYLGPKWGFNIDSLRMESVIVKTAAGLLYKETGRMVPDNYEIGVSHYGDIIKNPFAAALRFSSVPEVSIARHVFKYRGITSFPDDPVASAWLMTFYDYVDYVCWFYDKTKIVEENS